MTDQTVTPATGAVDAPVSNDSSMASVLAEFSQDTSTPKDDAVQDAVREMTEQTGEGDADAADTGDGEVEASQDEVEGDPEPEGPASDTDSEGRYTVKVNGEDRKVTLDELKRGYSREADYTAKTETLAADRRTFDAEKTGYQGKLDAEYAEKLNKATEMFVQLDPLLAQAQGIDWQQLAQADPTTYTQLKAAVDARVQAVRNAQSEVQRANEAQEQQRQANYQQGLLDTEKAIRANNAEFADDAKFRTYVNDGIAGLMQIGLASDELQAILSNPQSGPQVLSVIADANAWRAQQKAKAELPVKRVVTAPAARPLTSDAATASQPRKAPPVNASRDAKVSYAVKELLESQGT